MRGLILVGVSVVVALASAGIAVAADGVGLGQRKAILSANAAVQKAGTHFSARDYAAAGDAIGEAMRQIETAGPASSIEVYDLLLPAMKRVGKAHAMLQFEGISLPPFRIPARPVAAAAEPAVAETAVVETEPMMPVVPAGESTRPMTAPETAFSPAPNSTEISFTKTIAPLLSSRCGGCHINGSKGGFSLATFAALMKGPPEGVVIFAGDTVGSRLIETIETGDMPRGGGKVLPAELATLKQWIMTGAKFDGADPTAPISATGAGPTPAMNADAARPEVRRSTGKETVSFAKDIAPILVENCKGCHIDAMQTRGGLNMDNFARLLRGGDSGAVIQPGKGSESLVVKKLRGMEGDRMPAGGRPALPEASIQLISTWIDEGATLDGASENQPLGVMSQLAWAASATDSEMSDRREKLAGDHLKLANASGAPVTEKVTEHFKVIGTASEPTLELVGKLAEAQMKTVGTVVSGKPGEGFYHGRATIFVMPRRYDYSEFAKMVEARGVPRDWSSHWQFDGIDAYVAMVATDRDEEEQIASRLLLPLTGLAVATRGGDVPRWLAEGVATATAARKRGADREERMKMDAEISQAIAAMGNAKKFLDGKMTPEQSDRVGAAIASSLLDRTHRRNFDRCMRLLDEGKSFDQAFQQSFGVTTTAFVEAWIKWVRG
ncbi:Planctomycete cytochrome C [Rubripirellula tenax]|uniref:Planctomycete cytochrome C n=1 Tax=Rubripirellula tenax TaxID=2528015 RepID=A0A5C6F390_9BACT|nr:c-type cytochrome domain-containing protein [Rubripirellula tenax]TWU54516.1 Planctomycete cytochrome C [Rubripirellula tenax]